MIKYVVGFYFNPDKTTVILIKKNSPEWQKGKLNGVGGKIELHETSSEAMAREFWEETGISTLPKDWKHEIELVDVNRKWRVYFFSTVGTESPKSTTDEIVEVFKVSDVLMTAVIMPAKIIPNLKWLLPIIAAGNVKSHPFFKTYRLNYGTEVVYCFPCKEIRVWK